MTDRSFVRPVEDIIELDSLRGTVGLPPIDDYVKIVEQVYGKKVNWDPSLGIEDMS